MVATDTRLVDTYTLNTSPTRLVDTYELKTSLLNAENGLYDASLDSGIAASCLVVAAITSTIILPLLLGVISTFFCLAFGMGFIINVKDQLTIFRNIQHVRTNSFALSSPVMEIFTKQHPLNPEKLNRLTLRYNNQDINISRFLQGTWMPPKMLLADLKVIYDAINHCPDLDEAFSTENEPLPEPTPSAEGTEAPEGWHLIAVSYRSGSNIAGGGNSSSARDFFIPQEGEGRVVGDTVLVS